jgi:AcrR family transcriptional regulator
VKPRDEAKAQAILAATVAEVAAVGLAGLSMEAVARRARVATGTLYIYFASKAALVDAAYLATKQAFAAGVFRVEAQPVRIAFARMCVGYLAYLVEHGAEVVFMQQAANSPLLSASTRAAVAEGIRPVIELLERGKRERLLKGLDTALMTAFLQGTVRELAAVAAKEPRARRAARFDEIADLCWDALKA